MAINMKDVIEIYAIPKYIQLEYIHFNGAEYVPTGLYTTIEKYIEIDATVDNVSYSSATPITLFGLEWDYETGSYSTNYGGVFAQFFGNHSSGQALTNTNRFITNSIIHRLLDSTNALYMVYEVTPEGSGTTLNRSIYSSETDLPSYNPELCLGCSITDTNQKVNFWQGNVYNLVRKTSQYGTTEYNFVPAKRYIDGVAGLYDTINKVFYPMQGTTTTGTACGPEVSVLERYGTKKIENSNNVVIWRKEQPKVLTSITLSGQTTAYNTYATFSLTGTVTANYSNGTTADVTSSCTTNSPTMSTAGTKTITVSYTEDGVTKTATYNITVSKAWRTIYNNSTGKKVLSFKQKAWTKGGVPANVSNHTEQIRITYKFNMATPIVKYAITWSNGGSHAATESFTSTTSSRTKTYTYDQGHDILYIKLFGSSRYETSEYTTAASWYRNGLWTGTVGSNITSSSSETYFTVTKLEEYY